MRLRLYNITINGHTTRSFTEPLYVANILRAGNPGVEVSVTGLPDVPRELIGTPKTEYIRLLATYGAKAVGQVFPNEFAVGDAMDRASHDTEQWIKDESAIEAEQARQNQKVAAAELAENAKLAKAGK